MLIGILPIDDDEFSSISSCFVVTTLYRGGARGGYTPGGFGARSLSSSGSGYSGYNNSSNIFPFPDPEVRHKTRNLQIL
jgi:hypothetical protein